MKKILVGFGVAVVGLAAVLAWNLHLQQKDSERPPGSSGIVESTRVLASSRINSRILSLKMQEGERVRAGDVLAELDCQEWDSQVAAAEARLFATRDQLLSIKAQVSAADLQAKAALHAAEGQRAQVGSYEAQERRARKDSVRTEALYRDKVVDESSLDNVQTSVEDISKKRQAAQASAQAAVINANAAKQQALSTTGQAVATEKQIAANAAELKRVRAMQAECVVHSPVDGVITIRAHEPGDVIMAGTLIYEIRSATVVKIKFYVSNRDLGKVALAAPVDVVADAFPKEVFQGKVSRISEEAEFTPRNVQTRSDRDRLVYLVEAIIENAAGKLRAGMPVDVTVKGPGDGDERH